jgi:hypothetical protein
VLAGCGTQCDRNPNEPPIRWTGGKVLSGAYASSDWSGPWLDFPPGRTYRFVHGLGGVPAVIQGWFSFDANPVSGGGAVLAAGNQFTIEHPTTTYFDARNDTCSDVFLRVVASSPELASSAAAVSGGDASARDSGR